MKLLAVYAVRATRARRQKGRLWQVEQITARPQLGLELAQLESINPETLPGAIEAAADVPDRVEH